MTTCTDEWENCYETGWKGWIVPEAFSHPAKFSRCLIERIYDHALEMGWVKVGDWVLDPFAGVALGGLCAMSMGLDWAGVELEEKFVNLGIQNILLWEERLVDTPGIGSAVILQGDSRRLKDVIKEASLIVSSPPYSESLNTNRGGNVHKTGFKQGMTQGKYFVVDGDYGKSFGQLGSMPEGNFQDVIEKADLVVSSPPYSDMAKRERSKEPWAQKHGKEEYGDKDASRHIDGYGHTPGNLANMKEGSFEMVMSSPVYPDARQGWKKPNNANNIPERYGETVGQIGKMPEGSFDMCVSSPPYEEGLGHGGKKGGNRDSEYCNNRASYLYGDNTNLGMQRGDTFWSASHEIVQGCYELLKPGGHAIWVCKDYVKAKKRVPFSDRWLALCESVGFKLVCRHQAMLVKKEKETTKERKSFFRRLAETNIRAENHWNIVPRPDKVHYLREAKKAGWVYYRKMIEDNNPDHPTIFPTKSKVLHSAKLDALKNYPGDVRDWDDERMIDHEDILCLVK